MFLKGRQGKVTVLLQSAELLSKSHLSDTLNLLFVFVFTNPFNVKVTSPFPDLACNVPPGGREVADHSKSSCVYFSFLS